VKYFLDTEFSEKPNTIDLISLGIVADDGRELYLVAGDFHRASCNQWVQKNVLPQLHFAPTGGMCPCPGVMDHWQIRDSVLEFIGKDENPEFWGYYADYDWVAFCWLFGSMMDIPKGWPMYCRDLKQFADDLGNPRLPKSLIHNALLDARAIREGYYQLVQRDRDVRARSVS